MRDMSKYKCTIRTEVDIEATSEDEAKRVVIKRLDEFVSFHDVDADEIEDEENKICPECGNNALLVKATPFTRSHYKCTGCNWLFYE